MLRKLACWNETLFLVKYKGIVYVEIIRKLGKFHTTSNQRIPLSMDIIKSFCLRLKCFLYYYIAGDFYFTLGNPSSDWDNKITSQLMSSMFWKECIRYFRSERDQSDTSSSFTRKYKTPYDVFVILLLFLQINIPCKASDIELLWRVKFNMSTSVTFSWAMYLLRLTLCQSLYFKDNLT